MPQQFKKLGKPPQMPKKKMPAARTVIMLGVALCFSVLIFTFSIFPITAPIMIGVGAGVYAEHYTGSKTIGEVVGWGAGTFTGVAEFVSGVGVAAIGFIGEIMAFALTILGWMIIYFLLAISGIPFIGGGKSANKRLGVAVTTFIIGLIPFLNIIPTLLIGVTLIVLNVRNEDRVKLAQYKEQLKKYSALQKATLSRRAAMPQTVAANDRGFGDPDRISKAA
ncbi:MAG TPA: hypothetical protein ENI56_00380 [Candidatus Kaiserbacteria bacterium]|nr:hypothetical protein [Candidatus Kaiserbacteria bacterium]